MVHTNPDRPEGPPMNPDAMQDDTCNTNTIHEVKPAFSRSVTMGGTTPVAQEKQGTSHTTAAGPIPFNLSGSPQTTPPPVVIPKTRQRVSPLDGDTTVQQRSEEDSHKAPESLTSRKGLTGKSPGGLTLSTASTVVGDAPRESSSVTHQVAHDSPTAPAGASSQDPMKTPTKPTGSTNQESFQLPVRQAKIDSIAFESEESKKEIRKGLKEASELPGEADKLPQDVDTTAGATPDPTSASGPSATIHSAETSSSNDASSPSAPSDVDTPTIAALRAEIARLTTENSHLQSTLTAAGAAETDTHARYHVLYTRALRSDRENRQSSLLADRVHRHGQRAHDRAQELLTLYTRSYNDHRAALSSGQSWKARAEAAERENGTLLERALEAEREVGELRKWRAEAQVEGEGLWDKAEGLRREVEELRRWEEGVRGEAQGLLARVGKVEGELRVEREKAAKYRRKFEDLKIEKREREEREKEGQGQQGQGQGQQGQGQLGEGQNQQGQNQPVGGIVADIAARVLGRVNNELENILEDVFGKDVAKEKMAQAGWLAQDPSIHEPLELEMDDEKDMEERAKELGGFFNYAHQRGEFVKNAGMDATEEQFNKAMKMEERAREEVLRLGRKRTKSF